MKDSAPHGASDDAAEDSWPGRLLRYAGLVTLLGAAGTAYVTGRAFVHLNADLHLPPSLLSPDRLPSTAHQLRLFAAGSTWTATLILELVASFVSLVLTAGAFVAVGRTMKNCWRLWLLLAIGVAAVTLDIWDVNELAVEAGRRNGLFLSSLLASLSHADNAVRGSVRWARMAGEPAGICMGVAMCSLLLFRRQPTLEEIALRMRWVNRLLYAASLLFVVGIMMSRANFTWVLAHWQTDDDGTIKLLGDVVRAGVIQSGVGYSTLLAIFFLPVRAVLGALVVAVDPPLPDGREQDINARKARLAARDLGSSWQHDARQLLALLAPVLSAPVFDAIAKGGG